MKKKIDPLDNIVRDKLENLAIPYAPFTWEQLEQKLDANEAGMPQAENGLLDEVVFAKLHQVGAGDRPSQWHLLAAKLDANVDVHYKVLVYKIMEMAAVLLFLFIGSQYVSTSFNKSALPIVDKNSVELNTPTDNAFAEVDCNETNQEIVVANELAVKNKITSNNDSVTRHNNHNQARKSLSTNSPFIVTTTSPATPEIVIQGYRESPQLSNKPLQKQRSTKETIPSLRGVAGVKPSDLLSLNPSPKEQWNFLAALDGILVSELKYNAPEDYTMLIKPIRKRPNVIISMFGSGDYNHVITPAKVDLENKFEAVKRYAIGYGGGITAGFEIGRWELSTGAIYTSKEYQPRQVLYATGNVRDGYFIEGIKNIQLNTFNIPLHFRYNFIYHDKWRAYAAAGLSLQVAFQSNYFVANQDAFREELGLPPAPQREPGFGEDPLDESTLPKGFFEGGSLWENGYITGNMGLGIERYITGRWSVFAQPTYHHALNRFARGLGPDKDRIHTMSFFTGVRVRLNN